jgi:hypothetical protein
MSESYKGFVIECERTDAASPYTWCVLGIDGYVYHSGGKEYECSGDAESAAQQWIDYYINSLPNTKAIKIALKLQDQLKEMEEGLQKITDVSFVEHFGRMDAKGSEGGAKIGTHLFDALESITKAIQINEQVIRTPPKND